jgi:hypothetical protein
MKAILREELMLKENGCQIPIKEVRLKESPDKPKEELSKRSIKAAASTLYGLMKSPFIRHDITRIIQGRKKAR